MTICRTVLNIVSTRTFSVDAYLHSHASIPPQREHFASALVELVLFDIDTVKRFRGPTAPLSECGISNSTASPTSACSNLSPLAQRAFLGRILSRSAASA